MYKLHNFCCLPITVMYCFVPILRAREGYLFSCILFLTAILCKPVFCGKLSCPFGFKKNELGCNTCACNPSKTPFFILFYFKYSSNVKLFSKSLRVFLTILKLKCFVMFAKETCLLESRLHMAEWFSYLTSMLAFYKSEVWSWALQGGKIELLENIHVFVQTESKLTWWSWLLMCTLGQRWSNYSILSVINYTTQIYSAALGNLL